MSNKIKLLLTVLLIVVGIGRFAMADTRPMIVGGGGGGGDVDLTVVNSTLATLSTNKADKTAVYLKTDIDTALGAKADSATTYTKTAVDTALSAKMDKADRICATGFVLKGITSDGTAECVAASASTALTEAQVDTYVENNGYIKTETDPLFSAWNKSYDDLINKPDVALRDRATHTGVQAISTVTGLQGALDAKVATAALPTFTFSPDNFTLSTVGTTTTVTTKGGGSGASSIAELSDWPVTVSATEVSMLDGASSNLQAQITAMVVGDLAVTEVTTDPVTGTVTNGQIIANKTNGKVFIGSGSGMYTLTGTYLPNPIMYTLTVAPPSNGTITGTGINCPGDCTETVVSGTSVELTANPASGYELTSFSGALTGATNPQSVVMSQDRAVGASFAVQAATPSFSYDCSTLNSTAVGVNSIGSKMVANAGWSTSTPAGECMAVTGTSAYMKIAVADIDSSKGTIEFDYTPNYPATPTADQDIIFATTGMTLQHVSSTGKINLGYGDKNTVPATWSPVLGTKYHFKVTWDAAIGFYIYIDGVLNSSRSGAVTAPTITVFQFGREYRTNNDFKLDNIKIYKEVLP